MEVGTSLIYNTLFWGAWSIQVNICLLVFESALSICCYQYALILIRFFFHEYVSLHFNKTVNGKCNKYCMKKFDVD